MSCIIQDDILRLWGVSFLRSFIIQTRLYEYSWHKISPLIAYDLPNFVHKLLWLLRTIIFCLHICITYFDCKICFVSFIFKTRLSLRRLGCSFDCKKYSHDFITFLPLILSYVLCWPWYSFNTIMLIDKDKTFCSHHRHRYSTTSVECDL